MITKNLSKFAEENWECYKVSVTKASESKPGVSLVNSDEAIYCFDSICKSLFLGRDSSTSADGLQFYKNNIELVEFKSGFRQKISKEKFDPAKGLCPDPEGPKKVCEYYWDIFWKLRDKEKSELIASIRDKAIESYMLLEKHLFPICEESEPGKTSQMILTVVVDEDGVEGLEDTLAELAKAEPKSDNCFVSIRQALNRLVNRRDANGVSYFYDRIEVLSATDFSNRLKQRSQM